MLKADDKPIEEAVQSSSEPTIESAPSNEAVLGRSNESESVPSNKGGRNFPQEAVARGIANFDDRTLRRKRGKVSSIFDVTQFWTIFDPPPPYRHDFHY